ncbi:MAG: dodecin family protein [Candidatus Hadarchaeum sp.]
MPVIKVIELVGNSKVSWEDAAKNAVAEAAKTIRGITGIDVVGQTAVVENGMITEYRANVKVAFVVERGSVD